MLAYRVSFVLKPVTFLVFSTRPTPTSVDWKKRDAEYAVWVRDTATRFKEATTRPVQVTKTAIGSAIGAVTLLQQKLRKLPLTAQVLAGVVETREEYAVRRVWWAADLYWQECVYCRGSGSS
jgi:hypothetical protein